MAETEVKADVELATPIIQSRYTSKAQFSSLAGKIVKVENGKLFLLWGENTKMPRWIEVGDPE
ncbi:MAG: hypothetical protein KF836_08630 [Fimbriimonadaceae bacterium]|nr:hypothetical protein [Fimbriimonadaceae bacterium]